MTILCIVNAVTKLAEVATPVHKLAVSLCYTLAAFAAPHERPEPQIP